MRTQLKVLRVKNNLTQKEAAEKLGVSCPTYSLIEQGKRNGSTKFWRAVKQFYKLEDSELWRLYDDKEYAINPSIGVEKREV